MKKIIKQITLNDIAEKLNVSKVTISKALRDHPDISKKRTDEIKKIASEMGYIPNIAARNLSAKKTKTIGVIIPVVANSFFADIVEHFYNFAFLHDYNIILAVSQENSEKEKKHLETLLAMKVDGIIISIVENSSNCELFKRVKNSGIPLVFFDRTINANEFSSVTLANKRGAVDAVKFAVDNGYTKIGHVGGNQKINIGKDRYQGFKSALKSNGIKENKKWVSFAGFGQKDGFNAFMKMYEKNTLPEVIFAGTFPVALGIEEAAKKVGISIPEELDLICFGDSELNDYLNPSITCVTHDTKEFAEEAFNLILKQIKEGEHYTEQHIQIDTNLVIKETCNKGE